MKKPPPTPPPARAAAAPPRATAKPAAPERAPGGTDAFDLCRQWRAPQHERGRRRVDAILDAASAILHEGGLAALSVDAVAKRSQTSKSSMYHFFPDRDSIVRALADRHVAGITGREGFAMLDAVEWARLTVEEVADWYLEPFARYVREHPDVIPCMEAAARLPGEHPKAVLDAVGLERAGLVIAARQPGAPPAARRARAAALYAVTAGTLQILSRLAGGVPLQPAAMREVRRALVGYLTLLERPDPA
jgi:AcrR family transcriptional regulator